MRSSSDSRKKRYIYLCVFTALAQLINYLLSHRVGEWGFVASTVDGSESSNVLGSLGALLWGFSMSYPIASLVCSAIILITSMALIEQQIIKHNLIGRATISPLLTLVCFVVTIGAYSSPLLVSMCTFVMLYAIHYTHSIRDEQQGYNSTNIYLSSVMIGILPLIFSAAILTILMIIPIGILLTNRSRDFATLLIGFLTPTLVSLHIDYVVNGVDYWSGIELIYNNVMTPSVIGRFEPYQGAAMVLIGGGATLYAMLHLNTLFIPFISRVYLTVCALYVVVAAAMIALPSFSVGVLAMLCVPFTIFTSVMQSYTNTKITILLTVAINIAAAAGLFLT